MWTTIKNALLAISFIRVIVENRKEDKWLRVAGVLTALTNQKKSKLPLPRLEPVPWRKDTWLLVEDWTFGDVTIPKFFFCDLDSIPRIPFIYGYFKGYARTSAMVHDWYYATTPLSRSQADSVFYDLMKLEGVHPIRARLVYWAVRCFGWLFYGKKRGVLDALMDPEVRDADYP